jgi:tetratricopeptide (TPR) repeat protein
LLLAATNDKPAARHLIYFVNRLLVHRDLASAAQWVERLEKLDPDSLSTAAVKARVLVQLGKRDEANSLLRTLMLVANDPEQLIVIGRLMEENELYDSAEQAYRRYALRLKPKFGASADLPLARLFALRGRIDDALKIAESVNDCRPDAVYSVASAILQNGKINKNQSERLESWIRTAQKKSPDAASLNLALAGVYEQRLRAVEALAYYDRALDRDPNNISALNNSAMLLALTDRGKDALPRIERAIDLVGPLPPLLDTRATAQLALGNSAAAIADFQEAIALEESAVRRFHLALAHKAAGNEDEFARNIQKAKELKLTESMLNPLERDRWRVER